MGAALLATLNTTLPALLALYKSLRDANPTQPALTDAQVIDLLQTDSAQVEQKAKAWLAAHPKA